MLISRIIHLYIISFRSTILPQRRASALHNNNGRNRGTSCYYISPTFCGARGAFLLLRFVDWDGSRAVMQSNKTRLCPSPRPGINYTCVGGPVSSSVFISRRTLLVFGPGTKDDDCYNTKNMNNLDCSVTRGYFLTVLQRTHSKAYVCIVRQTHIKTISNVYLMACSCVHWVSMGYEIHQTDTSNLYFIYIWSKQTQNASRKYQTLFYYFLIQSWTQMS